MAAISVPNGGSPGAGSTTGPRQALLEAATELLTAEAPSAISGRRIAAAARVNYGQIHRLFGSKRELCRQVLDRLGDAFEDDAFPPGALVPTPGTVMRHDEFVRVLTHILLDQASLTLRPQHPIVERYHAGLQVLRPDASAVTIDTLVALSCSIQLGVSIHRASMARSAAIDEVPDVLDRELVTLIERLHAGRGPFSDGDITPRPLRVRGPVPPVQAAGYGRSQVETRLVAAAMELLAERTPAAISGRRLASRAGVNYGLIHQYFGSATEVLERASRQVRDQYFTAEAGPSSLPDFFSMRAYPGYVRALTHVALDAKLATSGGHFPIVNALLGRHESRFGEATPQQRSRYVIIAAAQLAWSLFEPLFRTALGREPRELEPYAATLLARMLDFEKHPSP